MAVTESKGDGYALYNGVKVLASEVPDGAESIPLDGMNVIEWDCDTTGLETAEFDGQTFYRLRDYMNCDSMTGYLTIDSSPDVATNFMTQEEAGVMAYALAGSYGIYVMGFSGDLTMGGVDYQEGLWVSPCGATSMILMYSVSPSVVESSGDGITLFNGVKFPNLPEWDKETYPYYFLTQNYFNYNGIVGYLMQLVATDTPQYKHELVESTTIVGIQKRCQFQMCTTQSVADVFGGPVGAWSEANCYETGSETFSDYYFSLSEIVWTSYDICDSSQVDNVAVPGDTVVISASSAPIPLDGMKVIEWDGDTDGLEQFAGQPLYRLADFQEAKDGVAVIWFMEEVMIADVFETDANDSSWYLRTADGGTVGSAMSNTTDGYSSGIYCGLADDGNGNKSTALLAYTPAATEEPEEPETPAVKKFPLRQFILGLLSELTAGSAKEPIAYLYNGVRLPKLPEWDRGSYPFAYIAVSSDGGYGFCYRTTAKTVIDGGHAGIDLTFDGAWYLLSEDKTKWESYGARILGTVVWANYDVYYSDSVEEVGGTLYLAASEPIPVYE